MLDLCAKFKYTITAFMKLIFGYYTDHSQLKLKLQIENLLYKLSFQDIKRSVITIKLKDLF